MIAYDEHIKKYLCYLKRIPKKKKEKKKKKKKTSRKHAYI